MKFNNKGFTMVELLVAMAILGLLIIMAFPTIRAIQANNTETKYEEYGKAVLSASKLYADSYSEDLFDSKINNQFSMIHLEDLVKKDLIKDINVSGATCINGISNVTIVKYRDDYSYCLHLYCNSKDNIDAKVYEEKNRKGSCQKFDIVTVSYENTDGSLLGQQELIKGEDDYTLLSEKDFNYNFSSKYLYLYKWKDLSNGNQYDPGKKWPNVINSNIVFRAVTDTFNYKVNFTSAVAGVSGSNAPVTCKYGKPCVITNGFSKDYYSFNDWDYKGAKINNNSDLDEEIDSGNIKLDYNNQTLTLSATFTKSKLTVEYYLNGGSLQPSKFQLCPDFAGCSNTNICTLKQHATCRKDGNPVYTSTVDFDSDSWKSNGLPDYNSSNGSLHAGRTGCTGTSNWIVDSVTGSPKIKETTKFNTAKDFAVTAGATYDNSLKKGDTSIKLFAEWNCPNAITCAAGTYLPKNKTSCATCLSKYYCLGGTFKKSTTKNQGLSPCPTGYKNSAAGSSKKGQCYMKVSQHYYVKNKHDTKATKCADNYGNAAEKVYYGKTSKCVKKPTCTITLSPEPNAFKWNNTNVKVTLNRGGGTATSYGLDTSKKSTNGKETVTLKNECKLNKKKEVIPYVYYGYVKNEAGSDTCSKTIKIDKTPPKYISKDHRVYNGQNEWYMYWKDKLSGLSRAQFGEDDKKKIKKASYVLYCYGETRSCSRFCTKNYDNAYHGDGGNNFKGTTGDAKGYWLRKALIADNFTVKNTEKDELLMQTRRACNGGKYTIIVEAYICDIAENCETKDLKYTFTY